MMSLSLFFFSNFIVVVEGIRVKLLRPIALVHGLHELWVDDESLPLLLLKLLLHLPLLHLVVVHPVAGVRGVHRLLGLPPQHFVRDTLLVGRHALLDLPSLWNGHEATPHVAHAAVESHLEHGLLGQAIQSVGVVNVMEPALDDSGETPPHVHAAFLLSVRNLSFLVILCLLSNLSLLPGDFLLFKLHGFFHGGVSSYFFKGGCVAETEAPSLVQDGRLDALQVSLGELVVHVVEDGELVVDPGDPVLLPGVLALGNLVNLLLKLLQAQPDHILETYKRRVFLCRLSGLGVPLLPAAPARARGHVHGDGGVEDVEGERGARQQREQRPVVEEAARGAVAAAAAPAAAAAGAVPVAEGAEHVGHGGPEPGRLGVAVVARLAVITSIVSVTSSLTHVRALTHCGSVSMTALLLVMRLRCGLSYCS